MIAQNTHFPLPTILPALKPLPPPTEVLQLFRQWEEAQRKPKQKQQSLDIIAEQDFKLLYEEKCLQLIQEITKRKNQEVQIKQLATKNAQLQLQIKKLRQEKWKGYDYTRLSARSRSKSHKGLLSNRESKTPTIEVKVPAKMKERNLVYIEEQNYVKTDRDEYADQIRYYRQEIALYERQNSKLKADLGELQRKMLQNNKKSNISKLSKDPGVSGQKMEKVQTNNSHSPQKISNTKRQAQKMKTPLITQFSPREMHDLDTIKKQQGFSQGVQFQIKRLKNQVFYKDLLLGTFKQEKEKEHRSLQKHLEMSVRQSERIAEHTTQMMNQFKIEIINLWKELEGEKAKNASLLEFMRNNHLRYPETREEHEPIRVNEIKEIDNMVSLLKGRRGEKWE